MDIITNVKSYFSYKIPLLKAISINFINDVKGERITVSAGHLAYVSLLSLVPVIMVFFMIMSAFPAFQEVKELFEQFIYNNFMPNAGGVLQNYLSKFVGNASSMGTASIISLLVVALLLISNIDKTFNHLWKTQTERPIIFTFAIYWMVISLGPLLIGLSLAVSSYLGGLATFANDYTPGLGTAALKLVPWVAAIGAFLILYMIVPNRPVRAKYAFFGALLATLLFELTKKGFAFYITSFPSYEVIYGALASIPILFLWVYLSWVVVLLGAVFTYSVTMTCERFEKDQAKLVADIANNIELHNFEDNNTTAQTQNTSAADKKSDTSGASVAKHSEEIVQAADLKDVYEKLSKQGAVPSTTKKATIKVVAR